MTSIQFQPRRFAHNTLRKDFRNCAATSDSARLLNAAGGNELAALHDRLRGSFAQDDLDYTGLFLHAEQELVHETVYINQICRYGFVSAGVEPVDGVALSIIGQRSGICAGFEGGEFGSGFGFQFVEFPGSA